MTKLSIQKRELAGKKVKNLRKQGLVPAVMFGPKHDSSNVIIDIKAFQAAYAKAGSSTLVDVEVEGEGKEKVLIKDVQTDPTTDEILHASLYVINKNSPISAEIPIEVLGVSPAADNGLGFVVQAMDVLPIRCLPLELPSQFEVNIDALENVGDSVTVAGVALPEGVTLDSGVDENAVIVFIEAPQKTVEEEDAEAAEAAAAEGEVAEGAEGEAADESGEEE